MVDTAATDDAFPHREFRIGQVLSQAFDVFFKNIVTFTLIAAVVFLPLVILGLWMPQPGGVPPQQIDVTWLLVMPFLMFGLMIFLSALAGAIILYGAFQHMRGRPVRLGESPAADAHDPRGRQGAWFRSGAIADRSAGVRVMDIPGRARTAPKSRLGVCRRRLSSSVRGSRCHPVDDNHPPGSCAPYHRAVPASRTPRIDARRHEVSADRADTPAGGSERRASGG